MQRPGRATIIFKLKGVAPLGGALHKQAGGGHSGAEEKRVVMGCPEYAQGAAGAPLGHLR